ncbi:MAG TPA: curli-like amyloid fiber formation chaperone CsgH [Methylovirgula sp.]|nr:curli-like amyloid fiber formation chaperone CsgH [Methylovirgula sp.]
MIGYAYRAFYRVAERRFPRKHVCARGAMLLSIAVISGAFSLILSDFRAVAKTTDDAAVFCRIRASETTAGLRIEALAKSRNPLSAGYTFSVVKNSAFGSSRNQQSGTFETDDANEKVLATVVLDRSAIDHYEARLSLKWNEERVSCSSP